MDQHSSPTSLALRRLVNGYQVTQAIHVAAKLGLADHLADGPRTSDDLARATDADPSALYRLLRALAALGVFVEHPDRQFELSAMGDFLRRDHPLSLNPAARMFGADYQWRAWGALRHSVETGGNAAVHALGMDVWEYRRLHPEHGEVFDETMRALSAGDNPGVLAAHDFGRYRLIADIGGGTGAVLAAVLAAHTDIRGVLFDQPHVIANADVVLRDAGVADRATAVPGDFFDGVPGGADAYLLVRVLHDWADAEALRIIAQRPCGDDARCRAVDC